MAIRSRDASNPIDNFHAARVARSEAARALRDANYTCEAAGRELARVAVLNSGIVKDCDGKAYRVAVAVKSIVAID